MFFARGGNENGKNKKDFTMVSFHGRIGSWINVR
jgi:hypothetical protein